MNGEPLIRVMVVDDEEPARGELKFLLEQHSDVCVVCEATGGQDALASVRQCNPHLVILDIEMPGLNGVGVAERILEFMQPLLVFATAHEEFALKAFELNAVDYLLKPFSSKRVDQCVARVRSLLRAGLPVQLSPARRPDPYDRHRLAIEQDGKMQIVNTADIIAVCSAEGHVEIYTAGRVFTAGLTLQELQARLDANHFFRSHRGCLVNIEKIREVIPWVNGTYNLILEGVPGIDFPVSRQQAGKLRRIFNL